ncbi:alpha/beta fold hydrolase [Micromonospora ureilytica]|uniref:Pimeloyl-ACP methyl ester carboxylesterase n=1 Tax=Micromonospora ureilytica TaxID=709868 RepID=A0ABS0JJY7_9ACTN|nr:alpha/beta hydrolase [Micromonospora ureilytica]MBG6067239.1 pimeloyl-ACP methyl ester carboxylesterase [Micromonospora ureilytica]WSR59282.1 alpha/beta hydrolase [Micromonospora ureilytica]
MTRQDATQRTVTTPDGRHLAVETSGAPDGPAVFLLHGTPGSRSGPRPRGIVVYRLGVHLVCYDRPGYGDSDRHEGRRVADAAADVAAIADDLGIDRFSVVGRSGGGPHALACAALLPDRVTRAAVLVGLAPAGAPDLDWYAGMAESNVEDYGQADEDLAELTLNLKVRADEARRDPMTLLDFLRPQLPDEDIRVVDDVAIRRLLTDMYSEAVRHGPEGWIDDVLAIRRGWGFDLGAIRAEVRLWHGEQDRFSPVEHSHWLAARIPRAEVQVQPGAAHFGAVEILPQTLTWLATPALATSPQL